MSFRPRGIYPALPTPVSEDGSLNYKAAKNHVEYLENNGVDGIVPAGCTGHAASLGDEGSTNLEYGEHVEFVKRLSNMTDLPVIAGDGMNSTKQTRELARQVEENADVDAHLVISPYQNCPPQDLIVDHYRQVAEQLDKPVIAYNVPGRTGRNIEAQTALELAEIEGVVGLKEASLDYEQIHEIGMKLQQKDIENFSLGSGDDSANHYVFQQGGDFAISVSANVHPRGVKDVWELGVKEKEPVAAYQKNKQIMPLHREMFQPGEKNPISVQYALNLMGFDFGVPRPPLNRKPLQTPEHPNRENIRHVLDRFDLL